MRKRSSGNVTNVEIAPDTAPRTSAPLKDSLKVLSQEFLNRLNSVKRKAEFGNTLKQLVKFPRQKDRTPPCSIIVRNRVLMRGASLVLYNDLVCATIRRRSPGATAVLAMVEANPPARMDLAIAKGEDDASEALEASSSEGDTDTTDSTFALLGKEFDVHFKHQNDGGKFGQ